VIRVVAQAQRGRMLWLVVRCGLRLLCAIGRRLNPVRPSRDRQAPWARNSIGGEVCCAGHLAVALGRSKRPVYL
jgi:hypothetical protein